MGNTIGVEFFHLGQTRTHTQHIDVIVAVDEDLSGAAAVEGGLIHHAPEQVAIGIEFHEHAGGIHRRSISASDRAGHQDVIVVVAGYPGSQFMPRIIGIIVFDLPQQGATGIPFVEVNVAGRIIIPPGRIHVIEGIRADRDAAWIVVPYQSSLSCREEW